MRRVISMADWITPTAALALGAALARANSCTVASARRLVFEGRADWLMGLAVAIAWAGLTMTLFAVALPQVVLLPAPQAVGWQVVLGAIVMGLGATMNQGCFLGSVAALGRGNLGYTLTLAGIMLALAMLPDGVRAAPLGPTSAEPPELRSSVSLMAALLLFAPPALIGLWQWAKYRRGPVLALVLVGMAGGAVYACNPDWSYTSGLYRIVATRLEVSSLRAELGAIAVVLGVVVSALLGGVFRLQVPDARMAIMHLVGGGLMGTGALLVPGGNDTLMLWAIPGLALYGLVAYATMIATIAALLIMLRQIAGLRSR